MLAHKKTTHIVTADYAIVFSEANFASGKLATLSHKHDVKILLEDNSPVCEKYGEFVFYKLDLQENDIQNSDFQFGYILSDLIVEKTAEIVAYPNFNASTNQECVVFALRGQEYVETNNVLPQNTKIFLYRGFNKKLNYTAICFVANDSVEYGYLKTDCINPNGINPVLITCVVLIVAILGIIFAWIFMKNKRVKIKK